MKPISLFVVGAHLFLLLWMALWMPVRKIEKKPLIVRTVKEIVAKPPPTPVSSAPQPVASAKQPPPPSKPPKKEIIASKKPSVPKPKPPSIPDALMRELKESIAKIEKKSDKELPILKEISRPLINLQIDQMESGNEENYAATLIQYLQSALALPEIGAVKLELTLKNDGTFVQMRCLESASNLNQKFLENELKSLKCPSFMGSLKEKKEHAFVITFCNH